MEEGPAAVATALAVNVSERVELALDTPPQEALADGLPRLRAAVAAAGPAPLALLGEPKYGADFKHFDWVNPDAPRGGEIHLAAVGSYDTFLAYQGVIRAVESAAVATGTPDFGRRLALRQGIEILGPVGVAAAGFTQRAGSAQR